MADVRITWRKSAIGYRQDQKDTIRKLGLRRLHQSVSHPDSPALRGMIAKVSHLVEVAEGDAR
jgi:large subunit ribosomal protein L30